MEPQPDRDLDLRLQKLEAELNQPATLTTKKQTDPQTIQYPLNQFISWLKGLPSFGKLVVIGITTIIGFAILRTVLHLVASLISLGLLGLLLYLGYKFFVARRSNQG